MFRPPDPDRGLIRVGFTPQEAGNIVALRAGIRHTCAPCTHANGKGEHPAHTHHDCPGWRVSEVRRLEFLRWLYVERGID